MSSLAEGSVRRKPVKDLATRRDQWGNGHWRTATVNQGVQILSICEHQGEGGICKLKGGPPMSNFMVVNGNAGWFCIAAESGELQQKGCGPFYSPKIPHGQSEPGTLK